MKKKQKDYTSWLVGGLSLTVIVVVLFLSYLMRQTDNSSFASNGQENITTGVQTATIVALPPNSAAVHGDMTSMNSAEKGSLLAGSRVVYKHDRFKKLALQPLEFEVFDEDKKALTPDDLKIVHESKMHFVVVSADLKEFQHLHPGFEKGKWKTLANLPNPGTYYAYIDISPLKGDPMVLRTNLIVQEETKGTPAYSDLTTDFITVVKDFMAQLYPKNLGLHQQAVLSFNLSTRTDLKAVTNITPYLGALGHVMIFRSGDPDSFKHLHALTSSDPSKGVITFTNIFATAGRYTLFAEFKIGKKVYSFPFTFDVK